MFFLVALIPFATIIAALGLVGAIAYWLSRKVWISMISGVSAAGFTYGLWTWDIFAMNREVQQLCEHDKPKVSAVRTDVDSVQFPLHVRNLDPLIFTRMTAAYREVATEDWGNQGLVLWQPASEGTGNLREISGHWFMSSALEEQNAPPYIVTENHSTSIRSHNEYEIEKIEWVIEDRQTGEALGSAGHIGE